ncbi:hypothetical protein AMTRI_Chr07g29490 [Amborella trichopoda]
MMDANRISMEGNHHGVKPKLRKEEQAQAKHAIERQFLYNNVAEMTNRKQENSVINYLSNQGNGDNSSTEGISNGNTESNKTYSQNHSSTIDNHHQKFY